MNTGTDGVQWYNKRSEIYMKSIGEYIKTGTSNSGTSSTLKPVTSYIKGYKDTSEFDRIRSVVGEVNKSPEIPELMGRSYDESRTAQLPRMPETVQRPTSGFQARDLSDVETHDRALTGVKNFVKGFTTELARGALLPAKSVIMTPYVLDGIFQMGTRYVENVFSGQRREEKKELRETRELPLVDKYDEWGFDYNTDLIASYDEKGRPLDESGKLLLYDEEYFDLDKDNLIPKPIVQPYAGLEQSPGMRKLAEQFGDEEVSGYAQRIPGADDPAYETFMNSKAFYQANEHPWAMAFVKGLAPLGENNANKLTKWIYTNIMGLSAEEAEKRTPDDLTRDVTKYPILYGKGATIGEITKLIALYQIAGVALSKVSWAKTTFPGDTPISQVINPNNFMQKLSPFGRHMVQGLARDAMVTLPTSVERAIDNGLKGDDVADYVAQRLLLVTLMRAAVFKGMESFYGKTASGQGAQSSRPDTSGSTAQRQITQGSQPSAGGATSTNVPPAGAGTVAPESTVQSAMDNVDAFSKDIGMPNITAEEVYGLPDFAAVRNYLIDKTPGTTMFKKIQGLLPAAQEAYDEKLDEVLSSGTNTGEVIKSGETVTKNIKNQEADILQSLQGHPAIAPVSVKDGKIEMPYYKIVLDSDTMPKEKLSKGHTLLTEADYDTINQFMLSDLIKAGYNYNDQLVYAKNTSKELGKILDFSNAMPISGEEEASNALLNNAMFARQFYEKIGATKEAKRISNVVGLLNDYDLAAIDFTDNQFAIDLYNQGNIQPNNVYTAVNARAVPMPVAGVQAYDGDYNYILTEEPLPPELIEEYELRPVFENKAISEPVETTYTTSAEDNIVNAYAQAEIAGLEKFNKDLDDLITGIERFGFHAGDLGKAEYYSAQVGRRTTGHFGTGTYFVGDLQELSTSNYRNRPKAVVDFSNYNLFTPKNRQEGMAVHEGLKYVNRKTSPDFARNALISEKDFDTMLGVLGISKERGTQILNDIQSEIKSKYPGGLYDHIDELRTADSPSTMFMKALGYEGVDVRGIKELDNVGYGSVIYDLKPESAVSGSSQIINGILDDRAKIEFDTSNEIPGMDMSVKIISTKEMKNHFKRYMVRANITPGNTKFVPLPSGMNTHNDMAFLSDGSAWPTVENKSFVIKRLLAGNGLYLDKNTPLDLRGSYFVNLTNTQETSKTIAVSDKNNNGFELSQDPYVTALHELNPKLYVEYVTQMNSPYSDIVLKQHINTKMPNMSYTDYDTEEDLLRSIVESYARNKGYDLINIYDVDNPLRSASIVIGGSVVDSRFSVPTLDTRTDQPFRSTDMQLDMFGLSPEEYYHGTIFDFNEFDWSKRGTRTGADDTSLGFYFTKSLSTAQWYGSNIKRVALPTPDKFFDPVDYIGRPEAYPEYYKIIFGREPDINSEEFESFSEIADDIFSYSSRDFKDELAANPKMVENIKKAGFVGFKRETNIGYKPGVTAPYEYILFDAQHIQSVKSGTKAESFEIQKTDTVDFNESSEAERAKPPKLPGEPGAARLGIHMTNNPAVAERLNIPLMTKEITDNIKNPLVLEKAVRGDITTLKDLYRIMYNNEPNVDTTSFQDFAGQFHISRRFDVEAFKWVLEDSNAYQRFLPNGYDALVLPLQNAGKLDLPKADEVIVFEPEAVKQIGGKRVDKKIWNHAVVSTDKRTSEYRAYAKAEPVSETYGSTKLAQAVAKEIKSYDMVLNIGGAGHDVLSEEIGKMATHTGVSIARYNPANPNGAYTWDNALAIGTSVNGLSDAVVDNGLIAANGHSPKLIHDFIDKAQNAVKPGGKVYASLKGLDKNIRDKVVGEFKKRFPGKDNIKVRSEFIEARQYRYIDTPDGERIMRYNYDVGRKIDNSVYMNSSDAHAKIGSRSDFQFATEVLKNSFPLIHDNIIGYELDGGQYHFLEVPGFDTEADPIISRRITIDPKGKIYTQLGVNEPLEHKWAYVRDNHQGFDVDRAFGYDADKYATPPEPLTGWEKRIENLVSQSEKVGSKIYSGYNGKNIDSTEPAEITAAIEDMAYKPDYENNAFGIRKSTADSAFANDPKLVPAEFDKWSYPQRIQYLSSKLSAHYIHGMQTEYPDLYNRMINRSTGLMQETNAFMGSKPENVLVRVIGDMWSGGVMSVQNPGPLAQEIGDASKSDPATAIRAAVSLQDTISDVMKEYTPAEAMIPQTAPGTELPFLGGEQTYTGVDTDTLPQYKTREVARMSIHEFQNFLPQGFEYMPSIGIEANLYLKYVDPMVLVSNRYFQLPYDRRIAELADKYAEIAVSNMSQANMARLYEVEKSLPEPLGVEMPLDKFNARLYQGRKLHRFISDIYSGRADDPGLMEKYGVQYEIAKSAIREFGYKPPANVTLNDKEEVFRQAFDDWGVTSSTAQYGGMESMRSTTPTSGGGGKEPPVGPTSGTGFDAGPERLESGQTVSGSGSPEKLDDTSGNIRDISDFIHDYTDGPKPFTKESLQNIYKWMIDDIHELRYTIPKAYIKVFKSRHSGGIIAYMFKYGLVDMNGKQIFKSFESIFDGFESREFKDFRQYLVYRRAMDIHRNNSELARHQQKIQNIIEDGTFAYLTPAEQRAAKKILTQKPIKVFDEADNITASDIIKSIEHLENYYSPKQNRVDFVQVADDLYKFQYLLVKEWGVKSGLLKAEAFEKAWEKYPAYVPFYRDIDHKRLPSGSRGFVNKGNMWKSMTGSEKPIMDPIVSNLVILQTIVSTALENRVGQEVYHQMMQFPEVYEGLFEFQPDAQDLGRFRQEINRISNEMENGDDPRMGIYDDEGYMPYGDNLIDRLYALEDQYSNMRKLAKQGGAKDSIVTVMINGEPISIKVHDPQVYEALTNMNPRTRSMVLRGLGQITRTFKVLTTGANPIYSLTRNIARDITTSFIRDPYTDNPVKFAADLTLSLLEMLSFYSPKINNMMDSVLRGMDGKAYQKLERIVGDIRRGIMDKMPGDHIDIDTKSIIKSFDPETYRLYLALGGGFGASPIPTRNAMQHAINQMGMHRARPLRVGLGMLETLADITESLPRFSIFKKAINAGLSFDQAIYMSDEYSTNFLRKGSLARELDKPIPYFSSQMAGSETFFRTFVPWLQPGNEPYKIGEPGVEYGIKGKGATVKEGSTYTGPKAGKSILKALLFITLPSLLFWAWRTVKEEEESEETGHAEVNEYSSRMYYLIPLGNGEYYRIAKAHQFSSVFANIPEGILDSIKDKNPEEMKSLAFHLLESFAPPTRSILAPVTDVFAGEQGHSWTGAPIVSSSLTKFEPADQYDAHTSSLAIVLGRIMNVSPEKIDYLFDTYGGGLADILIPMLSVDTTGLSIPDKGLAVLESTGDAMKRQVVTDAVYSSANISKYYDRLNELSQKKQSADKRGGSMTDKEKRELYVLNQANKPIGDIRSVVRAIEAPGEPPEYMINRIKSLTGYDYSWRTEKDILRSLQIRLNELAYQAVQRAESASK